ncbi:MAG: DUF5667 domain-containing protein [Candidatus Nanohaloarchaea archaeon]
MIKMKKTLTVLALLMALGFLTGLSAAQDSNSSGMQEASDVATPGEGLYFFKSLRERVQLGMARAPVIGGLEKEAEVLTGHADERVREVEALTERSQTERVQRVTERYSQTVEQASEAANRSGQNRTIQQVRKATSRHEQVLQRVSEKVPEAARQGIQTAIENSRRAIGRPESAEPGSEKGKQNESRNGSQGSPPSESPGPGGGFASTN